MPISCALEEVIEEDEYKKKKSLKPFNKTASGFRKPPLRPMSYKPGELISPGKTSKL